MALSLEVNPYLLVAVFVTAVTFLYRYLSDTYSVLQRLGVPGPKPVWVFGNVMEFKNKHALSVFEDWRKRYGDVYGFYEGFRASIVVNKPELSKDILNKHFDKFYVRTSYRPFLYYPDDLRLISIDGDHWKNQRSVLSKMLNSTATLKQVVLKVQKASNSMLELLETERKACVEGLNISKFVDMFATDVVMQIVLDMNDKQMKEHSEAILKYERESNWSAAADNQIGGLAKLFPSLTPLLKYGDKNHKECHDEMVAMLRKYLTATIESQNNNAVKEVDHTSFLSYLHSSTILSRDIDGSLVRRKLTTDETTAHVLSLLSESYSTTNSEIQFLLYELARNPDCQQRVFDEMKSLFHKDENISLPKLSDMEYFDKFFCEVYRHHPVAPGLSRVCTEDCTVQGVNFKKGVVVRLMTSPLYSDETIFENPQKFDPERFSKENRGKRHQCSFLPFGQGPRMCPGQKLASIQIKVVLISILRKYKLSTTSQTEVPLQTALRPSLTPKNDVYIAITPRH